MGTPTRDGSDLIGRRPALALGAAFAMALAWGCDSTLLEPHEAEGPDAAFSARGAGSQGGGSPGHAEGPTFLRWADDAPSLDAWTKSVEACRGEATTLEFHYEDDGSGEDDDVFLRLALGEGTLDSYPNGQSFGEGDCVTITVRVSRTFVRAHFSPPGLQFDPDDPAELSIHYGEADPDFDGDGEADDDTELEEHIDIVRQESTDAPWERLETHLELDDDVGISLIDGFTRYACAV